ncbi:helix-turn-helix domain-containing protein [Plantibacter sp. YIM 135347]|uniref:helix-turn-helix domain-containing protein n=1 Tax=Plantibacter sp. YIM 135347 TaxID=3423919 RepID=UPI003D33125E
MDPLTEVELRRRLSVAVVQDFIDDLPEDLRVSVLATRLRVSRASIMHHVRRGHLAATRVDGHWIIDVEASDRHLREMIRGVGIRRPVVSATSLEHPRTVYVPLRGSILDRLTEIMEREQVTVERFIEDLLLDRLEPAADS